MNSRGGRPSKLNDEMIVDITYGIEKGFTLKAACKYAGISYSTLACWMYKGKKASKNKNKYTILLDRINQTTRAQRLKHRGDFLLDLKPRDLRYGWKNPMLLITRNKISKFWQKRMDIQGE